MRLRRSNPEKPYLAWTKKMLHELGPDMWRRLCETVSEIFTWKEIMTHLQGKVIRRPPTIPAEFRVSRRFLPACHLDNTLGGEHEL